MLIATAQYRSSDALSTASRKECRYRQRQNTAHGQRDKRRPVQGPRALLNDAQRPVKPPGCPAGRARTGRTTRVRLVKRRDAAGRVIIEFPVGPAAEAIAWRQRRPARYLNYVHIIRDSIHVF